MTGEAERFYSQFQQDEFLETQVFQGKRNGVFVDIGANDGVSISNTYFFEKFRDWKGICVEPIPAVYERLKMNRKAVAVNGCIAPAPGVRDFVWVSGAAEMLSGLPEKHSPKHRERIEQEIRELGGTKQTIHVECFRLDDLLSRHGFQHVDYCSIDTEGGELEILKSIDLQRFQIDYFTVENNAKTSAIRRYLSAQGYTRIRKSGDEFYKRVAAKSWISKTLGI